MNYRRFCPARYSVAARTTSGCLGACLEAKPNSFGCHGHALPCCMISQLEWVVAVIEARSCVLIPSHCVPPAFPKPVGGTSRFRRSVSESLPIITLTRFSADSAGRFCVVTRSPLPKPIASIAFCRLFIALSLCLLLVSISI